MLPCICHFGLRGPERQVRLHPRWWPMAAWRRRTAGSTRREPHCWSPARGWHDLALQMGSSGAVSVHSDLLLAAICLSTMPTRARTNHVAHPALQGFVEAITHGVRVRAAAALVPERPMQGADTHFFTYRCRPFASCTALPASQGRASVCCCELCRSGMERAGAGSLIKGALCSWSGSALPRRVCFSLLSAAEQLRRGASKPLEQVQLVSRHWRILSGERLVNEVQGPGVVGLHPLLTAGEPLSAALHHCRWLSSAATELPGRAGFVSGVKVMSSTLAHAATVVKLPLLQRACACNVPGVPGPDGGARHAGGKEKSYESCTQSCGSDGAMEGSFLFTVGSMQRPAGPDLRVLVSLLCTWSGAGCARTCSTAQDSAELHFLGSRQRRLGRDLANTDSACVQCPRFALQPPSMKY